MVFAAAGEEAGERAESKAWAQRGKVGSVDGRAPVAAERASAEHPPVLTALAAAPAAGACSFRVQSESPRAADKLEAEPSPMSRDELHRTPRPVFASP